MADLVGLKFQVGLHTEDNKAKGWSAGHAKYPDLNQLGKAVRGGMDWCTYLDKVGIGIQYDQECGHKESAARSPFGEQTCVIAVPEDFATEALSLFPELTRLTPAEFEDFYDNKAHVRDTTEIIDSEVIEMINTKESAGLPVPEKVKALDPTTTERGIRTNPKKKWANFKEVVGINIV